VCAFIQYFWIWICKSVLKPSEVYIRSCSGSWKYVRRLNAKITLLGGEDVQTWSSPTSEKMEYEGACEMLLVNAVRNCMCVCVTGVASDLNIPLWSPIQLFVSFLLVLSCPLSDHCCKLQRKEVMWNHAIHLENCLSLWRIIIVSYLCKIIKVCMGLCVCVCWSELKSGRPTFLFLFPFNFD